MNCLERTWGTWSTIFGPVYAGALTWQSFVARGRIGASTSPFLSFCQRVSGTTTVYPPRPLGPTPVHCKDTSNICQCFYSFSADRLDLLWESRREMEFMMARKKMISFVFQLFTLLFLKKYDASTISTLLTVFCCRKHP